MVKRLYAPWREEFILGPQPDGCIFCDPSRHRPVRELILHRGKRAYVVMNRYPYTSGHVLVIPFRHVAALEDLTVSERSELMSLTALSTRVLKSIQDPAGMNIGMNLGRAAGAGIEGHLHLHVVPRWVGDTNFLPVLADTRIVSVDLLKLKRTLRTAFRRASRSAK
ncbi:MAG TPA: HIT domain-containing protein [candidate division Zixibacteria bacterium]|jgi:ATP adenylyltransferase